VWDGFVYRNDPPGVMQAFDVGTGKLVWKFDLIPQKGEHNRDSLVSFQRAATTLVARKQVTSEVTRRCHFIPEFDRLAAAATLSRPAARARHGQ